ncbi:hypothetical protein NC651_002424 [Populus alba x Populus x berolinensis]|nr:hypothetical protein NC651_002424 [Populus alba x Populus x berolinensis]
MDAIKIIQLSVVHLIHLPRNFV